MSAENVPTPEPPAPLCYEEVIDRLTEPLPSHLIKVRPGATTRDTKKAIALAYYDWRIMVERLNRVVGGQNWYARLRPWGDHKILCTLTVLGVPKDSSGEGGSGRRKRGDQRRAAGQETRHGRARPQLSVSASAGLG